MTLCETVQTPMFKCEHKTIPMETKIDVLGVTVDNKLKFECQIAKICCKVTQQIEVLKKMKMFHTSPIQNHSA